MLLRGLVSAYLPCLSWKLVFQDSGPTFPAVAGIIAGAISAAGAVAFGTYAWKRYQIECKTDGLTPEGLEEPVEQ